MMAFVLYYFIIYETQWDRLCIWLVKKKGCDILEVWFLPIGGL